MYEEDIDIEKIYEKDNLEDLSDSELEWLEQNDQVRLEELGEATNDYYRELMFPDGDGEDD